MFLLLFMYKMIVKQLLYPFLERRISCLFTVLLVVKTSEQWHQQRLVIILKTQIKGAGFES